MRATGRLTLWVAFIGLLGIATFANAQAPTLPFEELARQEGRLTTEQSRLVRQYIQHWLGVLSSAQESKAVLEARDALLAGFDGQGNTKATYQNTYAATTAELAIPAMGKLGDQLRPLKEVNLAFAVSRMPAYTIRPALQQMIMHANPAVRYYGWQGFREIRQLLLVVAQPTETQPMYQAMADRATAETSPHVLGAIYDMLQFPPIRQSTVPQREFDAFQKAAYQVLQATWARHCADLAKGDVQLAEVFRRAIITAEKFAGAVYRDDQGVRKAVAEMLLQAAWSSVSAYDTAMKSQAPDAGRLRDACSQLLRDSENALNFITQQRRRLIDGALTGSQDPVPGLSRAIDEWVRSLEPLGVRHPASPAAAPSPTASAAPAAPAGNGG